MDNFLFSGSLKPTPNSGHHTHPRTELYIHPELSPLVTEITSGIIPRSTPLADFQLQGQHHSIQHNTR